MGENLNYDKISMDVVEDKIALMDHDVRAVKDPARVKEIMDKTVEDQYQNRVGLGDEQLLKKLKMNRSSSPLNSSQKKKKDPRRHDLNWEKSTVTHGLRPQQPGYSLVNEKLQPPQKHASQPKE